MTGESNYTLKLTLTEVTAVRDAVSDKLGRLRRYLQDVVGAGDEPGEDDVATMDALQRVAGRLG